MKFLTLFCLLTSTQSQLYDDDWPVDIKGVTELFKSATEQLQPLELPYLGRIPPWVQGNFYRNGPGKFEFGEDQYSHFFDPLAIAQKFQFTFDAQKKRTVVRYNSKFIQTRNFRENEKVSRIVYPEVGTWAEDELVQFYPNGSQIEDEQQVAENRCKYLQKHFPTDNTNISLLTIARRWLLAMTETPLFHVLDSDTLDTVQSFDLNDAPNKPEGLTINTVTAHGILDEHENYYNFGSGLDTSGPFPQTVYFAIKVERPNDFTGDLPVKDPIRILKHFQFSELITNSNPFDPNPRYFHMFSATKNYMVLPLSSAAFEPRQMLDACKKGKSILEGFRFDENGKTTFRIFDKENFQWLSQEYQAPPSLQLHMIQATEKQGQFVDGDSGPVINFDTLLAGTGSYLDRYYFDEINQTGQALIDRYNEVLPIASPYRFTLPIRDSKRPINVEPEPLHKDFGVNNPRESWPGYENAGLDFPIFNTNTRGKNYTHFWSCGFGTVVPDRIYHDDLANKKRWVWRRAGFSPSEPVFIPRPNSNTEDDGVLITLASKIDENEPVSWFFVLDAHDLTELASGAMMNLERKPIHVPVGFHSYWAGKEALEDVYVYSYTQDDSDWLDRSWSYALLPSGLLAVLAISQLFH